MNEKFEVRIAGVACCAVLSLMISATALAKEECTPRHSGLKTVEEGYITPAAIIIPPFSFKENGVLKGVDPDILREIAKMECLEVKNRTIGAAAAIQSVISERSDTAIGDWYRTAKRAEVVALSSPIYLNYPVIWSKPGISTIAGLKGKKIGSVQGYLWTPELQNVFDHNVKLYQDSVAMQQDLMAGRIDAAVSAAGVGKVAKSQGKLRGIKIARIEKDERVRSTVTSPQSSFPVSKENHALLKAFNDDIKVLRESGTIAKILEKHGIDGSAANAGAPRVVK